MKLASLGQCYACKKDVEDTDWCVFEFKKNAKKDLDIECKSPRFQGMNVLICGDCMRKTMREAV